MIKKDVQIYIYQLYLNEVGKKAKNRQERTIRQEMVIISTLPCYIESGDN